MTKAVVLGAAGEAWLAPERPQSIIRMFLSDAGGIGQPLSLLLKINPLITEVCALLSRSFLSIQADLAGGAKLFHMIPIIHSPLLLSIFDVKNPTYSSDLCEPCSSGCTIS